MSEVQPAEIDDPSDDDQESDPSGGNSSNNESSGKESAGNIDSSSSSEEESDGDFDITGDKQSCPICGKKLTPRQIPFHNDIVHRYRPVVEHHVCIYCMEVFFDYFEMIAHQNQCLGNQL